MFAMTAGCGVEKRVIGTGNSVVNAGVEEVRFGDCQCEGAMYGV